jgi:hypothetical protein
MFEDEEEGAAICTFRIFPFLFRSLLIFSLGFSCEQLAK